MKLVHLLVFQALFRTSVRCLVLRNGIPIHENSNDFTEHETYRRIYTEGVSNVSSWETHVQDLVMCEKRSLDDLTHGKWYKTDLGHYLYEPDSCQLHRLSGELARRCLNRRPLTFMGDSVTRYQYLNLAYYLVKLERMEPYGIIPGSPSFCLEWQWKDWDQFYHFTSAMLGAATDGSSSEVCDCLRVGDLAKAREFRTLHLHFPGGCQTQHILPKGFVSLSYQQVLRFPDALSAGKAAMTALELELERLGPDQTSHLTIFNMGLHLEGLNATDHQAILSEVLDKGMAIQSKHNNTVLWKTTTPLRQGLLPFHHKEIEIAEKRNYAIYDVGRVVFAANQQGLYFYWDHLHFLPIVYQQFNDILLNSLCIETQLLAQ